jgi:hypothetical protein
LSINAWDFGRHLRVAAQNGISQRVMDPSISEYSPCHSVNLVGGPLTLSVKSLSGSLPYGGTQPSSESDSKAAASVPRFKLAIIPDNCRDSLKIEHIMLGTRGY